jgi:stage II sporulation protein D
LNAAADVNRTDIEVRVRLKRGRHEVGLTGYDLRVSPPSAFLETDPLSGFHRARVTWRPPGIWIVKIDHQRKPIRVQSERLWVRGNLIRLGLEPAPYDIELVPNSSQTAIDVVARLDMDDYIAGVLPAEMPASWPLEALKAQAVAARSFVLRQAHERRDKDFDVESTIFDQAYKFVDEVKFPGLSAKVKRAVEETKGEVLMEAGDRILKAFYSADCGCQSEDPRFVWGKVDAFESVKDPTCLDRRPTVWTINLDRGEVRRKLLAALSLPEDSSLKTLHIGGRTPSGRVSRVVAAVDVGGQTQSVALNSQEFRRIFGFQRIQSTDFSLRWLADQLEITGRGSGHGVGLCQRGAKSLSQQGLGYQEILKVYYPRARLGRMNAQETRPRLTSRD